jgi:predicted nuclease of predicted toxin-antitoxin system
MNLSPGWVPFLREQGFEAVHWSTVGDPRATDSAIMRWALANGCVVFTNDLDFGALLAVSGARGQLSSGSCGPTPTLSSEAR